jgi:Zn-dependent peptidase ImmA (M78 family)
MSPRSISADVNPAILVWARTTTGMALEHAAKRIGVKPERLAEWEAGARQPTVVQLRKAAGVYKRSLAVFFLPEAPQQPDPPHDFRRLPGEDAPPLSAKLLLEVRRARRRRLVALELLSELEIGVETFALSASLNDDADGLASHGREWLGVTLAEQTSWRNPYESLTGWLAAFERRGVLVFQTSEISVMEIRGFSLSERQLPVIVLNAKDAPRGRIFTLIHEFIHLTITQGGLCNPERVIRLRARTPDERVEVFCNLVAGALLVPTNELYSQPSVSSSRTPRDWDDESLQALAQHFAVSREVILRRLLILRLTTQAFYERKRAEYLDVYRAQAERAREAGGFAPLHRVALRDNGRRYTRLILEALERERITPADVSDYLGVRLKHLDDITSALDRSGEA